jgi:ketosteroid isomerase-like protein
MDQRVDLLPELTAEIAAARAAFVAALQRGDHVAAGAFYTDDARLLAPSAELLTGRDAIARFWRAGLEAGVEAVELECEHVDLEAGGATAFEIGRYVLRLQPAGGPAIVDRGKYLLVHRCEPDGVWRRAVETFNPDGDAHVARTDSGPRQAAEPDDDR